MAKKKIEVKVVKQPKVKQDVLTTTAGVTQGDYEIKTQQAHDAMRNTYTPAQLEQNPNLF